jgi:aspartate/methionine/tyrosine aminotransferase
MPRFARHAGDLRESATMRLLSRARQMKEAGEHVFSFGAGEPDFDTPAHVKEAGIKAIRDGFTKYTPPAGIPELRAAVAAKFRADGLEGTTPERTIVGVGCKSVLFDAIQVLCEEGDEVVVPTPYWVSYPEMVRATGARCVFVETSPKDRYVIDPDRLAKAVGPRTKAILLNSPGNPSGTVQPDEVQRAIGRLAAERGVFVISDEIYEHLAYAPARFSSFARLCPEAKDVTLLVNGTSKAYSMTGWRIGFGAGPKDLIERMILLQGHETSGPPGFCQKAALAALTGPIEPIHAMRDAFDRRRGMMVEALCSVEGLECPTPDGAFYALPDVRAFFGRRSNGKVVSDSATLAEAILEQAKVAVVTGDAFGAPYALRLSYACADDDIRRGSAALLSFFASLR